MPATVLDACCLIDLLASAHLAEILKACGPTWYLPAAVRDEVQFVRQVDPADPTLVVPVPVNLDQYVAQGLFEICQPDTPEEANLFIQYAAQFRSDGEAMCLALAESHGWQIGTDDRKAIRVGMQAGIQVVSCPELVKTWADIALPEHATLVQALNDIERFSQFRPHSSMPQFQWWQGQLGRP